MSVAINH